MRAERIEEAAGALLAASSRIEAETMCVVPRRLVDALRAALALPADAPAQPAPEGAGEAVAWGVLLSCDAKTEREARQAAAFAQSVMGRMAQAWPLHPTPRSEAASKAEAVREACAKACDERAAESRRMEALCGSAKREWTDLDLQEEVTTEAVECAKACRSLPLPPGQASAGGRVDASLLPLADGLLRDAEDAIAAHAGPGQHVGTPKVTVDALRLRNVARAVAPALRAGKGAR